jgi:hypothetical protein
MSNSWRGAGLPVYPTPTPNKNRKSQLTLLKAVGAPGTKFSASIPRFFLSVF